MKHLKSIVFFSLLVGLTSCSSDDSAAEEQAAQKALNDLEDLSINLKTGSIVIDGATTKQGEPPASNGDVPFALTDKTLSAYQLHGFDLVFDSPENLQGAYIQLKNEDGTMASEYLDIPKEAMNTSYFGKSFTKKHSPNKSNKEETKQRTINIDFKSEVTAGTFCYVICLYDAFLNVSDPIEVCVEVESWGGNADIIGNWAVTKFIDNEETTNIGEEDCDESFATNLTCENGSQLEYNSKYCSTNNNIQLILNSDGSYSISQDYIENYIDYEESRKTCKETLKNEEFIYTSNGKWAFNEEDNTFTLVNFGYSETETITGEISSEKIEKGTVEFIGTLVISGNTFILTDNNSSETYTVHFKK